jgi:hypothetical protein
MHALLSREASGAIRDGFEDVTLAVCGNLTDMPVAIILFTRVRYGDIRVLPLAQTRISLAVRTAVRNTTVFDQTDTNPVTGADVSQ